LIEIDGVRSEGPEAPLAGRTDVLRATVGEPLPAAAHEAALRRHEDLVPLPLPGGKRFGHESLVRAHVLRIGAVDVRGVEEPDARVERGVKEGDSLLAFEAHRAQAEGKARGC
jgi:hypothetical protein